MRRGAGGAVLACALLACALPACGAGESARSPVRQTVESLGNELFVPLTADFVQDARQLERTLSVLCEERDPTALERAREAWSAAATRFKQTEVIAFGPHTLSPWRLGAKIDFWPAREDQILQALREHEHEPNGPRDEDAATAVPPARDAGAVRGAELGAAARGLPVIEYLLYAGGDGHVLAGLDDVATAGARCAYLRALGTSLVADARELHDVWSDSFAHDLSLRDGPNAHFATVRAAFSQIVNSLAFVVEDVRTRRLQKPLGGSRATAHPEVIESRYSARSIRDALDALQGVENVFTGRYGERQALGLGALLRARGRPLDRGLAHRLEAARDALRAIESPLDVAVVEDRQRVQDAIVALDALLVFLQVDVNQALAVTATFGAGDGD